MVQPERCACHIDPFERRHVGVERSAIRIRDAIRKEMNDMTQPFPPLDASVGRFEHMRYTGDGALSFDPVTQLFQAEGTVRIIVQYA